MSLEQLAVSPSQTPEAKPLRQDLETLEQHVRNILKSIRGVGKHPPFRCWEIARFSAGKLREFGYEPEVKTGLATYNNRFLQEHLVEEIKKRGGTDLERREEWLSKEHHEGWSMNYHSWIEIGDLVVDIQNKIGTPTGVYHDVLVVDRSTNLKGKVEYLPIGREFSFLGQTFIYIPRNNYGPRLISRLKIRNPKLDSQ